MSKMAAALALDADASVAASSLPRRNVCYTFFVAAVFVAVVTFNARTRLGQHGERDN